MKITRALLAGVAMLAMAQSAQAACALAGTWHLMAIQGTSPDIKSTTATVRNSADNGSVSVKVFPNAGAAFKNDTARILKCKLVIAANGSFSNDPCSSFGVGGSPNNTTVSGNLTLSSCDLGGTINVQGDPTPVTIKGGHINGVSGAFVATQGAKQVLHFTLIKN